jgi:outer membrane protein W
MSTNVVANGTTITKLKLDPSVVGIGIGYRF